MEVRVEYTTKVLRAKTPSGEEKTVEIQQNSTGEILYVEIAPEPNSTVRSYIKGEDLPLLLQLIELGHIPVKR